MTTKDFFSDVGIDSIGFYAPKFAVDLEELAIKRNVDPEKYKTGMLLKEMRIPETGEDIVTMSIRAGYNALSRGKIDPKEIDALFVGTETITYSVKSISNILAEILGISDNSITQDVYNACAAASLAVINAISMVQSGIIDKALVIGADICTYDLNSSGEPTQGAGAIALVISKNPRIARFSKKFGRFSRNINDFYRSAGAKSPKVFGKYSVESYLKFQMGAFDDLNKNLGDFKADYYVFHAPFSKLPIKFIQKLIMERTDHFIKYVLKSEPRAPRSRLSNKIASIRYSLKHFPSIFSKILLKKGVSRSIVLTAKEGLVKLLGSNFFPQLNVPHYFGNMYSASVYAQLMYIMENSARPGDVLYYGSYGSGATCLSGLLKIMPSIYSVVDKGPKIEDYMRNKVKKTIDEYEALKNNTVTPYISLGFIAPHKDNDNRNIVLHFCDKGCLISNVKGLDYCPQGHSGFIEKTYPLYAVLKSVLKKTSFDDLAFLKNGYVKIIGQPKLNSFLEFDMRRVKIICEKSSPGDGLLNWAPFYVPITKRN